MFVKYLDDFTCDCLLLLLFYNIRGFLFGVFLNPRVNSHMAATGVFTPVTKAQWPPWPPCHARLARTPRPPRRPVFSPSSGVFSLEMKVQDAAMFNKRRMPTHFPAAAFWPTGRGKSGERQSPRGKRWRQMNGVEHRTWTQETRVLYYH